MYVTNKDGVNKELLFSMLYVELTYLDSLMLK